MKKIPHTDTDGEGPVHVSEPLATVLAALTERAGPKAAVKLRDLLDELKYGPKGGAA